MLSKKSSILLSSYSGFAPFHYPSPQSCTSSKRPARSPLQICSQIRSYPAAAAAQPASDPSDRPSPLSSPQCDESDLHWPEPVQPHQTPTPYQILSLRRGDRYSKRRFYALVKLYHPDRCHPSSPVSKLPHTLRIERYRLLIAAHTILSDDEKRRAYDLWGHGWTGHKHNPSSRSPEGWTPTRKDWPPGHDPMMNASWEDWERWYRREYNGQQYDNNRDPYMKNSAFIAIVLSLVSVGLVMQGTRANMMSINYMEQQEKIHKAASMELAKSKRATMTGDREERIRTFLEHREAILAGEDAYQRILPHPETCAPDTVRKR
jgi:curved DNA-binding protein CbpA